MNLNELAKEICKLEGGKKSVNVAQVKEILRCLGGILRGMDGVEALKLIQRLMK